MTLRHMLLQIQLVVDVMVMAETVMG